MTPGEAAYTEDCCRKPTYTLNGRPRASWNDLGDVERSSWEKNPTPREYPVARYEPNLEELPDELQRTVGANWLRQYGHIVSEDPSFVAASVYRMMRLAKAEPDHPSLKTFK